MNDNQEIKRLRKAAEQLTTLNLQVKTEEELKAEIDNIFESAKNFGDKEVKEEIRLLRQGNEIKQVLADYEKQYGMSTVHFFRKYIAGETDDCMDFVEWASLAQMIAS